MVAVLVLDAGVAGLAEGSGEEAIDAESVGLETGGELPGSLEHPAVATTAKIAKATIEVERSLAPLSFSHTDIAGCMTSVFYHESFPKPRKAR